VTGNRNMVMRSAEVRRRFPTRTTRSS